MLAERWIRLDGVGASGCGAHDRRTRVLATVESAVFASGFRNDRTTRRATASASLSSGSLAGPTISVAGAMARSGPPRRRVDDAERDDDRWAGVPGAGSSDVLCRSARSIIPTPDCARTVHSTPDQFKPDVSGRGRRARELNGPNDRVL